MGVAALLDEWVMARMEGVNISRAPRTGLAHSAMHGRVTVVNVVLSRAEPGGGQGRFSEAVSFPAHCACMWLGWWGQGRINSLVGSGYGTTHCSWLLSVSPPPDPGDEPGGVARAAPRKNSIQEIRPWMQRKRTRSQQHVKTAGEEAGFSLPWTSEGQSARF